MTENSVIHSRTTAAILSAVSDWMRHFSTGNNVVAARTVKAGNDAAFFVPSDRILRLIAVMLSRRRTRNAKQLCAVLTANARQRITHFSPSHAVLPP